MVKHICPDCYGVGVTRGVTSNPNGHSSDKPCGSCGGTGVVKDQNLPEYLR